MERCLSFPFLGQEEEEEEEDETKKILDVEELGAEEAKYLLEKLLTMSINQTCLATQKEGRIKVLVIYLPIYLSLYFLSFYPSIYLSFKQNCLATE